MSSATYELKFPARCLATHYDESFHGFLVTTANLRGPNEIRLLRYAEESDDIRCIGVWAHNYEVNCLASNPTDKSLVGTVYNTLDGRGGKGTIWSLPELPEGGEGGSGEGGDGDGGTGSNSNNGGSGGSAGDPVMHSLERVCDLPLVASATGPLGVDPMHHMAWAPAVPEHRPRTLVTAHAGSVRAWSLGEGGGAVSELGSARLDRDASFCGGVAWDPHHPSEVAVAADGEVVVWDVKSGDRARAVGEAVEGSSGGVVRALSYNTNKPWMLATAGDDYRVKLWDLRKCAAPVKILDGHTHWATCVAFNPFHDQLIVSGGGDARVNLWRVPSVSSAPLLELGEEDEELIGESSGGGVGGGSGEGAGGGGGGSGKVTEPRLAADQAVRVHSDHCDSVVGLTWSLKNAWVYASLSYSGRLAVSIVPSAEKYRVLL